MALRGLVKRNVDKAFSALGDLAIDVVLTRQDAIGYDFDAGETETSSANTLTVKGVIVSRKHVQSTRSRLQGKINATLSLELLIKAEDLPAPDVYDHVRIYDQEWEIYSYDGNEYVYTLNLIREGFTHVQ